MEKKETIFIATKKYSWFRWKLMLSQPFDIIKVELYHFSSFLFFLLQLKVTFDRIVRTNDADQ